MRKFIALLLLLAAAVMTQVASAEWYLGVGYGKSHLNYDVESDLNKYLKDNAEYTVVLNKLGATPRVTTDNMTSEAGVQKIYLGYMFTPRWGLELSSFNLGSFAVKANIPRITGRFSEAVHIDTPEGSYDVVATATGYAEAEAGASASASGYALQGVMRMDVTERVKMFVTLGVAKTKAIAPSYSKYEAGYEYSYTDTEGVVHTGGGVYTDETNKTTLLSGYIPVIGLGFDVGLTKNIGFRLGLERYGDPSDGVHVDSYHAGMVYRLK